MKLLSLFLISILFTSSAFGTGIPLFTGTMIPIRMGTCCHTTATCSMTEAVKNPGTGHCTCNIPNPARVPHTCSCSQSPVMAPVQGVSDRVRQFIIRGYKRITKKNVLNHPSRQLLYDLIGEHPGIDVCSLASKSGMNEYTIKYHLDRIVMAGYVSVHNSGGCRHYFENHGSYSQSDQILLSRMHEKSVGKILTIVGNNPGLSRGELARLLGVSGPVITRSMQTLAHEGLIRQSRDGKYQRYYPGWNPLLTTVPTVPETGMPLM